MSSLFSDLRDTAKIALDSKLPLSQVGQLLRIVHSVNTGNYEQGLLIAQDLAEHSHPQMQRPFTQWLGSEKYHDIAMVALSKDLNFAENVPIIINETHNSLRRAGLIKLAVEDTIACCYLAEKFDSLSHDEQKLVLNLWVDKNELYYDKYIFQVVHGDHELERYALNKILSQSSVEMNKRFANIFCDIINRGDSTSDVGLSYCNKIVEAQPSKLELGSARDVFAKVMATPADYPLSHVKFALKIGMTLGITPDHRMVNFALINESFSFREKEYISRHAKPENLTEENRVLLAMQYDNSEGPGSINKRCFEFLIKEGWLPPQLPQRVESALDKAEKANSLHRHLVPLIGKLKEDIFEHPNRVQRVQNALNFGDESLFNKAMLEVDKMPVVQQLEILKKALPDINDYTCYDKAHTKYIQSLASSAGITEVIKYTFENRFSKPEWRGNMHMELLTALCMKDSSCRQLIRNEMDKVQRGPSPFAYKTLGYAALASLEADLHSEELSVGNTIFLPTRIQGDPQHLLARGFRFGFLNEKNVNVIEAVPPVSLAKEARIDQYYVLLTEDNIPLARIYADIDQKGGPLILEPFPYSEAEAKLEGSPAAALKKQWLSGTSVGGVEGPEYSLSHRLSSISLKQSKLSDPDKNEDKEAKRKLREQGLTQILRIQEELFRIANRTDRSWGHEHSHVR